MDSKGILVILVLFYKVQKKNYLMMDIAKYFSSSKKRDLRDSSKEGIDLKNQVANTATMMFLKKSWTLQVVEVFFLIA